MRRVDVFLLAAMCCVASDVQADETSERDIMITMWTWHGINEHVPYREGSHVFTPKSNYKPRFFTAPVANLVCWLIRTETSASLRCWPSSIPKEEVNGANFVTSYASVNCESKEKDEHLDDVAYCKGSTPGTGAYDKTHEFACVEIAILCIDHGFIHPSFNALDK